MHEKAAATLVVLIAGAALVAATVISSTDNMRPYGEQAMLARIAREDGALCTKFGVAAATPNFDDCMRDLADLRQRHVNLLRSHWWL